MAGGEDDKDQAGSAAVPPPGEGEGLEDAAADAVREIERRRDGGGHAGAGDIG
jgi:hypothetical protein